MREVKPVVVSFSTNPNHPGLDRLTKSLYNNIWPFLSLTDKVFPGWGGRLKRVINDTISILSGCGYTHMIHVDAYDVIATGPPSELAEKLAILGDPHFLMAAEHGCWPDGHLRDKFEPIGGHWWFPHSQFCLDITKPVPKELIDIHDHEDDQRHFTKLFFGGYDWLKIDRNCHIFQSFAFCSPESNFFEKNDEGRWCNKLTGTKPLFFHGNGGTNGDWLWGNLTDNKDKEKDVK